MEVGYATLIYWGFEIFHYIVLYEPIKMLKWHFKVLSRIEIVKNKKYTVWNVYNRKFS